MFTHRTISKHRFKKLAFLVGPMALSVAGCAVDQPEEETGSSVRQVSQAFSGSKSTVDSEYSTFRSTYIVDVDHCGGVSPCKRVARLDEGNDTVSEGIAYGMLLAAYLDDQSTLDGLWNYYRTHLNANGVMHWRWDENNNLLGENEATDAIEDAAIALIVADKKGWGSAAGDGQTYSARANDLIGKIMTYFVTSENEPKPGDANWDVWERTYNPSYIFGAYATVYADYTGDTRWDAIKDKEYQMLASLDSNYAGAANTGLVPDWMYHNGTEWYGSEHICDVITWDTMGDGSCRAFEYSYDATRIGWRLAMDWQWHGDSRAGERLDRINAWAKPKNGEIVNGYHLDGTEFATNQYPSGVKEVIGAFVGPIASASVKDSQSYQDTMWNKLVSLGQGSNYYSDAIRIINLAFLGGAMPHPLNIGDSGGDGGSDGGPTAGTYYSVKFRHSGKCLDVSGGGTGDGDTLIQWGCHGNDNQQLKLIDAGGGYYALQFKHSGKCVDVYGASADDGADVIQWGCHYNDNQLFQLVDHGGGYYSFKYKHSGKCVDVEAGGSSDGDNVLQWGCHGNDNQQFSFQ